MHGEIALVEQPLLLTLGVLLGRDALLHAYGAACATLLCALP
jgi:hypothetical protein